MKLALLCLTVVLAAASTAQAAGSNALADAARDGNRAVVRALVAKRADVNAPQPDGTTALHWAARHGDQETVQLLLKAGANARAANRYGVTPVSLAAQQGHGAIVEALLAAGADPNAMMGDGETVLMTASRAGDARSVTALLARDAAVNVRESLYGETALMWAAAENHADVVTLLLGKGADANLHSNILEGTPSWREGKDGRSGKANEALQALLTVFPRGGLTPLLFAAREGAADAARALVQGGADPGLPDPDGITPLIMAINSAHFDVAKVLVDEGADVDQADPNGRTPLFAVADMRALEWAYNIPGPAVQSPVDSLELAALLVDKGANANARLKGRPTRAGAADPNSVAGSTPFLRACVAADLKLMDLLLSHGADPKATNAVGTNALMIAAGLRWNDNTMKTVTAKGLGLEKDALTAIQRLLDKGLDINAANNQGQTALHGAAMRGSNAIVRFLVDHGARVDARSKPAGARGEDGPLPGRTPLDEALASDPVRDSTAQLLRELMAAKGIAVAESR
jgi:ankyrin repeat protein